MLRLQEKSEVVPCGKWMGRPREYQSTLKDYREKGLEMFIARMRRWDDPIVTSIYVVLCIIT